MIMMDTVLMMIIVYDDDDKDGDHKYDGDDIGDVDVDV